MGVKRIVLQSLVSLAALAALAAFTAFGPSPTLPCLQHRNIAIDVRQALAGDW